MRLDKFLQLSRLVKHRSWAKEACDKGRVKINGQPAKPGKELTIGQQLEIHYARKILTIEVLLLPGGNVTKKDAAELFRVVREDKIESDIFSEE